jgi:hypothetical protein
VSRYTACDEKNNFTPLQSIANSGLQNKSKNRQATNHPPANFF